MAQQRTERSRLHWQRAGAPVVALLVAVTYQSVWSGEVVAQTKGSPRICVKLVADGNAQIAKFESNATRLLLAESAGECRERLTEFTRSIEGLDRAFRALTDAKCEVDKRLSADERRKISDRTLRLESVCAGLEKAAQAPPVVAAVPDVAAPAPSPAKEDTQQPTPTVSASPPPPAPVATSPATSASTPLSAWQRFVRLGSKTPTWLLTAVFLSLLSLVVLSITLGRLSRRDGKAALVPAPRAAPVLISSGSGRNLVETIAFIPTEGGPAYPIEASRLDGDGITVGRDPKQCDLVVTDKHVSSRHARIWRDHRGVHIKDLGSTNGTWRDGKRVATATLTDGEAIRLGQTSFRLARGRA